MFTPKTLTFLRALERNNRREWFVPRKDDYERHVRTPMMAAAARGGDQCDQSKKNGGEQREGAGVDRLRFSPLTSRFAFRFMFGSTFTRTLKRARYTAYEERSARRTPNSALGTEPRT